MINVLDRNLHINQSYLLEASAGTGKTYSIENIFARLIIEGVASVNQILVVTFTRAATAELKHRIRQNIAKVLEALKGKEAGSYPDYILALLEQEKQVRDTARRRLEQALFCFDQSQIFTIHGFCSRMLKEHSIDCDLAIDFSSGNEPRVVPEHIYKVIKDYFRTEVTEELLARVRYRLFLISIKILKKPYTNLLLMDQKSYRHRPSKNIIACFAMQWQN